MIKNKESLKMVLRAKDHVPFIIISWLNWSGIALITLSTVNIFNVNNSLIWSTFVSLSVLIFLIGLNVFYSLKKNNGNVFLKKSDLIVLFAILLLLVSAAANHVIRNNFNLIAYIIIFIYFLIFNHVNGYSFSCFRILLLLFNLYQMFLGVWQSIGFPKNFPPIGSFENSNLFIYFLVCTLPITLDLLWNQVSKLTAIAYLGILTYLLLISDSRLAGFIFFLSILFAIYRRKHSEIILERLYRNKGLQLVSLIIIILALAISLFYKTNSTIGRMLIWTSTVHMIVENPFTGVGIGKYPIEYPKHQLLILEKANSNNFKYVADLPVNAFNEILEFISQVGVFSIMPIFYLLYKIFNQIKKTNFYSPLLISICFIILISLFSYPFSSTPFIFITGFFLTFALRETPIYSFQLKKNISISARLILFISSSFFIISFLLRASSLYNLAEEKKINRNKDISPTYIKLYNQFNNNGLFLYEFGLIKRSQAKYEEAAELFDRASSYILTEKFLLSIAETNIVLQRFEKAHAILNKLTDIIPNRLYPRLLLLKISFLKKEYDLAEDQARALIRMKEKVKSKKSTSIKLKAKEYLNTIHEKRN